MDDHDEEVRLITAVRSKVCDAVKVFGVWIVVQGWDWVGHQVCLSDFSEVSGSDEKNGENQAP